MRLAFVTALLLGAATLTGAQPPKEPEPRYNVKPRLKQFPQTSPKETLKGALLAIEKADYTYLVAQLLDPKFVDDAVTERSKLFDAAALAEISQLRDFQIANPNKVAAEDRVPLDPKAFRALAVVKARDRGFKQLARDIEQKITNDPQTLKDIRSILRDGAFAESDPAAAATHPEIKGRGMFFKKIGDRWFLENRQVEEKKDP